MTSVQTVLRRTLRFSTCTNPALTRSLAKMSGQEPATTAATAPPWHAAYPSPRNPQPGSVTRDEVLAMLEAQLKEHDSSRRDFVLFDLRRADCEGGTIRGSINVPAQSLYPTIPTLYSLLRAAGVRKAIWYCSSSRGRGPRAAGWFGDYVSDRGHGDMQSLVMLEGIKGWATAGPEYTRWMDAYDESAWLKS